MCALVDDNDDHDKDDYDGAMILMVVTMILVTYEWPMSITLVHVWVLMCVLVHVCVLVLVCVNCLHGLLVSITLVHVCVLVDQIRHRAVAGQVAHLSKKHAEPEQKT